MTELSIILPTYNEKDNIILLVNKIIRLLKNYKKKEIIIVDDSSPDNTYSLVKKKFEMQKITKHTDFVPWTVSIKINNNFTQKKRNNIMSLLGKMGIETRNGFYSPYELPIFSKKKGLPVSLMLSRRIINLPLYEGLSELKVKYICSVLDKVSK